MLLLTTFYQTLDSKTVNTYHIKLALNNPPPLVDHSSQMNSEGTESVPHEFNKIHLTNDPSKGKILSKRVYPYSQIIPNKKVKFNLPTI